MSATTSYPESESLGSGLESPSSPASPPPRVPLDTFVARALSWEQADPRLAPAVGALEEWGVTTSPGGLQGAAAEFRNNPERYKSMLASLSYQREERTLNLGPVNAQRILDVFDPAGRGTPGQPAAQQQHSMSAGSSGSGSGGGGAVRRAARPKRKGKGVCILQGSLPHTIVKAQAYLCKKERLCFLHSYAMRQDNNKVAGLVKGKGPTRKWTRHGRHHLGTVLKKLRNSHEFHNGTLVQDFPTLADLHVPSDEGHKTSAVWQVEEWMKNSLSRRNERRNEKGREEEEEGQEDSQDRRGSSGGRNGTPPSEEQPPANNAAHKTRDGHAQQPHSGTPPSEEQPPAPPANNAAHTTRDGHAQQPHSGAASRLRRENVGRHRGREEQLAREAGGSTQYSRPNGNQRKHAHKERKRARLELGADGCLHRAGAA